MKHRLLWTALSATIFLTSCHYSDDNDEIISQRFIHKYGFAVSEKEWQERAQEGQVITSFKNGIIETRTFEGGKLHGPTTITFSNSSIVEKLFVYDQGILIKEVFSDATGIPIREEVHEFDDRLTITMWDHKGSPLSTEEYDDELLIEGKYYTPKHELEGLVEAGFGKRIKRDRQGLLISSEKIENGVVKERTNYHPNGQIQAISRYHDYQLHGEQVKYSASGKPLLRLPWDHGVLNGQKVVYRNGVKIAEIPYRSGKKWGVEKQYNDLGDLVAEIAWKIDKKHGLSQYHTEETTEFEWFYKGQTVSGERFQLLEERQRLVTDLTRE